MDSNKSVVVVVVDRLGAAYLGPYGNTWINTPAFNQLAADSILVEHAVSDSPDLRRLYRSFWQGVHAACGQEMRSERNLASLARGVGLTSVLLSDEELLLSDPLASCFDQRISLVEAEPTEPARSIEETQVARAFLAAAEQLERCTSPHLIWLHARAMDGTWDAPLEMREQFREEGDPHPYLEVVPPLRELPTDHDPDELLSLMHAYAAEVLVIDTCVGTLLSALAEYSTGRDTLFVFTAPRGFALGEHGWVGAGGPKLFGEVLNVPMLVRIPNHGHAGKRLQTLAQPASIFVTIADWLGLLEETSECWQDSLPAAASRDSTVAPNCAIAIADDESAIRTPSWFLHLDSADVPALFAKPDDRWEVNEISSRCPTVAHQLAQRLLQFTQLARSGQATALPQLELELVERFD